MSPTVYSIVDLIKAKRDKGVLTAEQIQYFIDKLICVEEGRVHDSQIGAFLMAAFLNGLNPMETSALTRAMAFSGFMFKWPVEWKGKVVDKHSTGGVGDKVSLILAPALAACGLKVPMISGRGLDFTGGTLDKLESIPGFTVSMAEDEIKNILDNVGCCIVGQSQGIVPADKLLYAIRDTTATVDNEDLIVASILSKKAAEGLDALVMDVKTGTGALMKDIEQARSLATKLVTVGNSFGMKVTALITNMDAPLGKAVGNALEVAESIETLKNKGPKDLHELVLSLGGQLLASTGHCENVKAGEDRIEETLIDGSALAKFEKMITSQGTPPVIAAELCYGNKWAHLPRASSITPVKAYKTGFVTVIDALLIARVCHALGCGRTKPGQSIKFEPGVILYLKPGQFVNEGDTILEMHHESSTNPGEKALLEQLQNAYAIENTASPAARPLVLDIIC